MSSRGPSKSDKRGKGEKNGRAGRQGPRRQHLPLRLRLLSLLFWVSAAGASRTRGQTAPPVPFAVELEGIL